MRPPPPSLFFFFNDTATTEIYTLSLHDALPISSRAAGGRPRTRCRRRRRRSRASDRDRKSTRLNSSHDQISYAVFCLKKKKNVRPPVPATSPPPTRCAHPRTAPLPPPSVTPRSP